MGKGSSGMVNDIQRYLRMVKDGQGCSQVLKGGEDVHGWYRMFWEGQG